MEKRQIACVIREKRQIACVIMEKRQLTCAITVKRQIACVIMEKYFRSSSHLENCEKILCGTYKPSYFVGSSHRLKPIAILVDLQKEINGEIKTKS